MQICGRERPLSEGPVPDRGISQSAQGVRGVGTTRSPVDISAMGFPDAQCYCSARGPGSRAGEPRHAAVPLNNAIGSSISVRPKTRGKRWRNRVLVRAIAAPEKTRVFAL